MGTCKGCGEVFSAIEMENGYCKSCKTNQKQSTVKLETENNNLSSSPISNTKKQEVIVTDIKMPFMSMVFFMVKWVIASIPAFIILAILVMIASAIIGSIVGIPSPRPY
jgi:hypothetical protein